MDKNQITGKRLIMKGAICAGLVFDSNARYAYMVSEVDCTHGYDDGLPLRVKWIKPDTFVLIEREQRLPDLPPRTFVYSVRKIQGNKVLLTEYWTGWNDFKDEVNEYTLK